MSTISVDRAGYIRKGFVDRLKKSGFKPVGFGCFSEVYGRPDLDYVYKVSVLDRMDDGWLKYANLVLEKFQGNPHAPKIMKLKTFKYFYVAKMEKLEFTVSESNDIELAKFFEQVAVALHKNPSNYDTWEFEKNNLVLAELMTGIRLMFETCDFHDDNAMVRHDGTFVITDPIY